MKPFPTSAACCFGILFISVSLITTGSSEVQVVGSADPVVALTGDDVILPCSLKPSASAEDMLVKWTGLFLETRNVHLYLDGRDFNEEQHPSYRRRTSMFKEELKNGNVSLKLTRVTLSDAGSYKCFIPSLTSQVKETTVQLIVGAVSQPVISIDGTKGWGVVLKCESGGWYPEPEMVWLDSSGTILPADGPPERYRVSEDLYTVRQHVTVDQADTNRFTCIVQQPEINHKKETEIHVPDLKFPKSQLIFGLLTAAVVVVVLAASAVGLYKWRKRIEEKKLRKLLENLEEHVKDFKLAQDKRRDIQFVNRHRFHLIQTVTTGIPIAFYKIRSEKYSEIHAARTRQDQMKLLYEYLDSESRKAILFFNKSDFYRILLDLEPDVVIDLGAKFVDDHKDYLIQKVTLVKPIIYELFYELYCNPRTSKMNTQDQMRQLYQALEEAEDTRRLKSDFYRILLHLNPPILRDLEKKLKKELEEQEKLKKELEEQEKKLKLLEEQDSDEEELYEHQNLAEYLEEVITERENAQFVDMNRFHLIQNVTMVIPIAFYLIRSEKYSEIHAAGTREDQMELLYEALDSGGEKLKSDFYWILLDLQPDLVKRLETARRKQLGEDLKRRLMDRAIRERDELKEELRKAEETIKTLSTSPEGQQKTQTPSQKSEGIEDEGMEMESLPGSGRKSLLGPGMEMKPLLGSGPQKDDLDEMERGGRVTTEVDYRAAVGLL